jgi:hypothetical protein
MRDANFDGHVGWRNYPLRLDEIMLLLVR